MTVKELRQMLREWGRCHQRMRLINEGPQSFGSPTAAACHVAEVKEKVGVVVRATNPEPEYQLPRQARVMDGLVEDLEFKHMVALQSKYIHPDDAEEIFRNRTSSRRLQYWVYRAEKELLEVLSDLFK